MSKAQIRQFIESKTIADGMIETGIPGVQLFKVTESIRCAPAVYEPSVTAIVSGSKEAIWEGNKQVYDSSQYICCTMSMPIEAGTPQSSADNPLYGVYISLDTRLMTELIIELETYAEDLREPKLGSELKGLSVSHWDEEFTGALIRLLELYKNKSDIAILSKGRLRELYYAILKGESGHHVRRAFGVGNKVVSAIELLSSRIHEPITIDEIANQIGMSRAVFHRRFKQATNMSPIQFVKAMRLNNAAMRIANGTHVNVAAMEVGYVSSSQFSREFKRMYGLSPKQWGQAQKVNENLT